MKTVFFDLDGTLTDPKPGITGAFQYALERSGLPVPPQDDLEWVIGPALIDSFARFGVPDPQQALIWYRENYTGGRMYDCTVFAGIPETLATLRGDGLQLCVATAKPHAYARKITAHFGLAPNFAHEFGPELDGTRNDKAELLAFALERLHLDPAECLMIGDRSHDIVAATSNRIRAVHVQWGYGRTETAGAVTSLTDPTQLVDTIRQLVR